MFQTILSLCRLRGMTKILYSNGFQARFKSDFKTSDSFVLNLFANKIVTNKIFPYPKALTDSQREELELMVPQIDKSYGEMLNADEMDRTSKISNEIFKFLGEQGAFGIQIPTKYGGLGFTNTQFAKLTEVMAKFDLSILIMLGAHQSIGLKGILLYGTEEQKKKYLPKLATGEHIAAYCLTEPSSGSDANSIRSKAVLSNDKSHYILNGSKIWITNGGIAKIFTVFAQVPIKDEKTGETKNRVTAFIVEREFQGVTSGKAEDKMGIRSCNTTELYFDNVKIPVANVLGEVGNGFKVAVNILNSGRFAMCTSLAGAMKAAIKMAVNHAATRVQFGNTLDKYGSVQEKLYKMAALQYTAESVGYLLAGIMDQGQKEFQMESAIGKIFASEAAWNVVDEAIQIHGGMGFMRELGLERVLRDLRIFRIFEGANDVLRLFISLTGCQYAGKNLMHMARSSPMDIIKKQGKRLFGSYDTSIIDNCTDQLKGSANDISFVMNLFGISVEKLLLKYKKEIIHEQMLLSRISNAVIDIFTSVAVLSRVNKTIDENLPSKQHEILLSKIIIFEAMKRAKHNLNIVIMKNAKDANMFNEISQISKNIIENEGVLQGHPTNII